MPASYKIKVLLVTAIAVIILTYAASEGMNVPKPVAEAPQVSIPYPQVPQDIDPGIIDTSIGKPLPTPRPSAPVRPVVPTVSAEAYLVANLDTGEIYSSQNTKAVFPIASLSKLVTALVALQSMSPDQMITITQPMLDAYGEAGRLALGESYTVSELLYPLLLESSNDAAEALALFHGYSTFIQKMNALVAELGMTSTSFRDASGLSSGNGGNAEDLFKLAQYIYRTQQPLLTLTRQVSYSVASSTHHGAKTWHSINPFPYDPHFMGGKTGRTYEAKESMISLFRYNAGGISYPVAIIVLRSDFSVREEDSSYLFEQFIRKIEGR